MSTTKAILKKIKVDGELRDLIAQSDGENVTVTYNGKNQTLSSALAEIFTTANSAVTEDDVQSLITEEVAKLINGAPEAGDTLKELFDLITTNSEAAELLTSAVSGKVDKVEGKGLSTEDFTTELKEQLEALPAITASDVDKWNGIRGVRVGEDVPDDLKSGELFVQLINEE